MATVEWVIKFVDALVDILAQEYEIAGSPFGEGVEGVNLWIADVFDFEKQRQRRGKKDVWADAVEEAFRKVEGDE